VIPDGPGKILDEYIRQRRILWVLHAVQGAIAALAYWIRPGTFTPHIHAPREGDGFVIIVTTLPAWMPYLISALTATSLIPERTQRGFWVCVIGTVLISVASDCFYLGLFKVSGTSPLTIAVLTLLSLLCVITVSCMCSSARMNE
jgi:hypothetical protein